jgi:branched-chain amino acid transport system substrate-binding protein
MKKNIIIAACFNIIVILIVLACSRNPSGHPQKVKIGYIVDETGPAASYTDVQKKGISIALDELKQTGRAGVEVIYEDSKLEPKNAVNAVNKLITIDKVSVVFTLSSQETIAVMPIVEKASKVLLAPLPSSPELTDISKYFFRISPSDAFQGMELATLAMSKGFKKAAVLYVNDIYGKSLADAFTRNLMKLGGEVLFSEGYAPKTRDFRTILTKISGRKPQVVFFPVYPDDAIPLMKQYRELKLTATVFGADTFSNPTIFKNIPDAASGVIFASPAKADNERFKKFLKAYQTKYGTQPDVNAAAAYDAVMLIDHVTNGMTTISGDAIRIALEKLDGYSGTTGPIKFDSHGDVIGKKFAVYEVKKGAYDTYH